MAQPDENISTLTRDQTPIDIDMHKPDTSMAVESAEVHNPPPAKKFKEKSSANTQKTADIEVQDLLGEEPLTDSTLEGWRMHFINIA